MRCSNILCGKEDRIDDVVTTNIGTFRHAIHAVRRHSNDTMKECDEVSTATTTSTTRAEGDSVI